MDPRLKRRLLIAIIIVALAVIFLPIPFGHLKQKTDDQSSEKIPPAPSVPVTQSIAVPAESHENIKLDEPVVIKKKVVEGDLLQRKWVVQIASFPEKSQAQQRLQHYKNRGYRVFIESATVHGHTMYRVNLGPYQSKEAAKNQLKGLAGMSAYVRPMRS